MTLTNAPGHRRMDNWEAYLSADEKRFRRLVSFVEARKKPIGRIYALVMLALFCGFLLGVAR